MDTSSARLSSYNFIVVFRELRLNEVLLMGVRRLLPALPNPLVTEIPNQLIGVVYPDHAIQCQFANRRVDIRHSPRTEMVGEEPFSDVAVAAVERAKESGSQDVIAYGFNYDVQMQLRDYDSPGQYIVNRFIANPNLLTAIFGGHIEDGKINVSIAGGDCRVNFDLEGIPPDAPNLLKAHVNYHFADQAPPNDAGALRELMQQQYEEFFRALQALPD